MAIERVLENKLEKPPANPLAKALSSVGISKATVEVLQKNSIERVFDLMLRVPKSVVEQADNPGFAFMEEGRHYVATGKVVACKISGHIAKRRLEAILEDDTGRIHVVFFGPAVSFAQKFLKSDAQVTIAGEAKTFLGRFQMIHPKFISANSEKPANAPLATYGQIGGLNSATFKKAIEKALQDIKTAGFKDHLSQNELTSCGLVPLAQAIMAIHEPNHALGNEWDQRKNSPNFRRLAFEELLKFYVQVNKAVHFTKKTLGKPLLTQTVAALTEDLLPFSLTNAQKRVVGEIVSDMSQSLAMTRLVQGDVGSGKTAVSAAVARHAVLSSLQVAVLAPTEILAEQLFKVYLNFFKNTAVRLALLTASTKQKERTLIVEQLMGCKIDIIIGTHALLSDDVKFGRLGLLIIDEQHRFGVNQRAEILKTCSESQGFCPHLLVMSATPIPRSLALTFYGDLELSVIDERPQGRIPVHTQILMGPVLSSLERLCERIRATNQKAFIVFPLVQESEVLDLENATKAVSLLQAHFGPDSAALVHGKMKPDEKALAMTKFRESQVSFLVATTVIEVGIDIPDATCIAIVHPERFGLAQLHQLRGRVGRSDLKSFCFLITDIKNRFGTAFKRLDALCKTHDGFKLAEIDLEHRGPGELLGTKQSGLPNFLVFNHFDFADLLPPAKALAKNLVQQGPKPDSLHLFSTHAPHIS